MFFVPKTRTGSPTIRFVLVKLQNLVDLLKSLAALIRCVIAGVYRLGGIDRMGFANPRDANCNNILACMQSDRHGMWYTRIFFQSVLASVVWRQFGKNFCSDYN
jgi:hypothetical protein